MLDAIKSGTGSDKGSTHVVRKDLFSDWISSKRNLLS